LTISSAFNILLNFIILYCFFNSYTHTYTHTHTHKHIHVRARAHFLLYILVYNATQF